MSQYEPSNLLSGPRTAAPSNDALDLALTAQIAVAWAGEGGDEPRLGWWRIDLVSEFGGEDFFQLVTPLTWRWAVLQGAREAARRHDAGQRATGHDPDRLLSLFHLGTELDEAIEERLLILKRSGRAPEAALPGLRDVLHAEWDRDAFGAWLAGHGAVDTVAEPVGRRLRGAIPETLEAKIAPLLAGLLPLPDQYPLSHYRRSE